MDSNYLKVEELLQRNNQQNIITILKTLPKENQDKIIKQILSFDFEQINNLYEQTKSSVNIESKNIETIKSVNLEKLNNLEKEKYQKLGEEIIKNGKYALITMAGGQGTRLGHTGPKGTYKITTNLGDKYLFEIIVDNLLKAKDEYNVVIPWYIMTSDENNNQTVDFFEENNYFGYPKSSVKFFIQGKLPMLDFNGKLILSEEKIIKEASDGNGGIYKSLLKNEMIKDMEKNGVEWIFVGGIDNILLNVVDPILVGLSISEGNSVASKSIEKKQPTENVGVFCKNNGKPIVIEYTELSEAMANQTNSSGELTYCEVNIVSHAFSINALKKLASIELPYHIARKKCNYINENGDYIKVDNPNAYKFESFIFDGFAEFDNMSILRVKREDEFAPIKNAIGNDSPQTAIELFNKKHS